MNGVEKTFDINMVLLTAFTSLETMIDINNVELIYDMDPTIPKELKGNPDALTKMIMHMLTYIIKNSDQKEIILSMHAPKDFLYKESISFEIRETGLDEEKTEDLFKTQLNKNIELLDAEMIVEEDHPLAIHINIPFKLGDLGNRRYYRLPDIGMLGKKVFLICKNKNEEESIKKMFKYFLYDVDAGIDEYKKNGSHLDQYDIFVIEDKHITKELELLVEKVQKSTALKYVILQSSNCKEVKKSPIKSANLIKPVVEESIYELIISLFEQEMEDRTIKVEQVGNSIDIEKHLNDQSTKEEKPPTDNLSSNIMQKNVYKQMENENEISDVILDTELGEENIKRVNKEYKDELKAFLDTFGQSDKYFRDIVHDKAVWQIKEFCIDLEKNARFIGALGTADIAARVSLVFVYDQLDTLPIYIGKYHRELEKLVREIKAYLDA